MILTREQLELREQSEDNIVNKIKNIQQSQVIHKSHVTNPEGKTGRNLTQDQRADIGFLATVAGDEIAAEVFGVAESTAHQLKFAKRNVHSHGDGEDRVSINIKDGELKQKIEDRLAKTKGTIQEVAAERLLRSLGLITDEKMENSTAKELAGIASQVSSVIKNVAISNESGRQSGTQVKVIINQPKPSGEHLFETIELGIGS